MQSESNKVQSDKLLILAAIMIVFSVGLSFYRYYVVRDYSLYVKESCNPVLEECLSEECDIEDPRCAPSEDGLMYYKETYMQAGATR